LQLTSVLQATIDTARTDQARALEATLRDHAGELQSVTVAGRSVEDYTRTHCAIELNADSIPTAAGP
jgi:hypothetical protein